MVYSVQDSRMEDAMTLTPTRHRFTEDDYYRMAVSGVLGEDDRVELLEGEVKWAAHGLHSISCPCTRGTDRSSAGGTATCGLLNRTDPSDILSTSGGVRCSSASISTRPS